jgi:hypothetical protein
MEEMISCSIELMNRNGPCTIRICKSIIVAFLESIAYIPEFITIPSNQKCGMAISVFH